MVQIWNYTDAYRTHCSKKSSNNNSDNNRSIRQARSVAKVIPYKESDDNCVRKQEQFTTLRKIADNVGKRNKSGQQTMLRWQIMLVKSPRQDEQGKRDLLSLREGKCKMKRIVINTI